jgi:hypothetical protein
MDRVPSNKPSPDQQNVYYSNVSILSRLENWLTEQALKNFAKRIEDYYTPWYVLDETKAPNSFVIDVYTRDNHEIINTIILQFTGEFLETPQKPTPIFTTIKPKSIADRGDIIELNSTFHANTSIKEGTLNRSEDESRKYWRYRFNSPNGSVVG